MIHESCQNIVRDACLTLYWFLLKNSACFRWILKFSFEAEAVDCIWTLCCRRGTHRAYTLVIERSGRIPWTVDFPIQSMSPVLHVLLKGCLQYDVHHLIFVVSLCRSTKRLFHWLTILTILKPFLQGVYKCPGHMFVSFYCFHLSFRVKTS